MVGLRKIGGIVFIVLGIAGLFLPVLQGVLFILIGLVLLFPENQRLRRLLEKARTRYPEQAARLDALRRRAEEVLGRRS